MTSGEMMIPEEFRDLLDTTALIHVATIGPNGEPQSNPVWFDWDGQYMRFSQTKTRQKYRNLQRDPRIAVSLVDPTNPYRYLEIRGRVVRIDDDPDNVFIDSMAKKYLNMDTYPYHQPGDERIIIVIEPQHTTFMGN
jgi:hypothetical protein